MSANVNPLAHVASFRGLTAVLERMRGHAARLPEGSQKLLEQVDQQNQERRSTHRALSSYLSSIAKADKAWNDQIDQHLQSNQDKLAACRDAAEQSALSIREKIGLTAGNILLLRDKLSQNLNESHQQLQKMNQAETWADEASQEGVNHLIQDGRQIETELAEIQGSLARADEAARQAVVTNQARQAEANRSLARALNQQAVAACAQGSRLQARALLDEASRLDPDNISILLNLAQLYLEMGQSELAEQSCQRAAGLAPGSREVLYLQGRLSLLRGEVSAAIDMLQAGAKAAVEPAEEVRCRLGLAEACYTGGRAQEALTQWRRVVELEPLQPVAQQWLRLID